MGRVADGELAHRRWSISSTRPAMSSCRHSRAQRRAALAGAVEAGGDDVLHHLLGQRRGIDDHRVLAAGLGDQAARAGRRAGGQAAVDERATSVEPVKITRHPRVGDQRRAHGLAGAGQQLQHRRRNARRVEQAHRPGGDQRRLLGGLGQHRAAGGQRRRHLADEDRQREVPRADAGHRPRRRGGRPAGARPAA